MLFFILCLYVLIKPRTTVCLFLCPASLTSRNCGSKHFLQLNDSKSDGISVISLSWHLAQLLGSQLLLVLRWLKCCTSCFVQLRQDSSFVSWADLLKLIMCLCPPDSTSAWHFILLSAGETSKDCCWSKTLLPGLKSHWEKQRPHHNHPCCSSSLVSFVRWFEYFTADICDWTLCELLLLDPSNVWGKWVGENWLCPAHNVLKVLPLLVIRQTAFHWGVGVSTCVSDVSLVDAKFQ